MHMPPVHIRVIMLTVHMVPSAAGMVPLHLDPYGLYADFGHERITSLHDLLDWV